MISKATVRIKLVLQNLESLIHCLICLQRSSDFFWSPKIPNKYQNTFLECKVPGYVVFDNKAMPCVDTFGGKELGIFLCCAFHL